MRSSYSYSNTKSLKMDSIARSNDEAIQLVARKVLEYPRAKLKRVGDATMQFLKTQASWPL